MDCCLLVECLVTGNSFDRRHRPLMGKRAAYVLIVLQSVFIDVLIFIVPRKFVHEIFCFFFVFFYLWLYAFKVLSGIILEFPQSVVPVL